MSRYACAPDIVWTHNGDHLLVVARESGQSWTLRGSEALLWEWLCLGHPTHTLIALLAAVDALSGEAAADQIAHTIRHWQAAHLVEEQHG